MITLQKANLKVGEGRTASINIDFIIALQEQPSAIVGQSTTAVFVQHCPPLFVKEKEADIVKMIAVARRERANKTGPGPATNALVT